MNTHTYTKNKLHKQIILIDIFYSNYRYNLYFIFDSNTFKPNSNTFKPNSNTFKGDSTTPIITKTEGFITKTDPS